jgi:outer membrane protein assembly factor BamB
VGTGQGLVHKPVVSDGIVYTTSGRATPGTLYALNAYTGEEICRFVPADADGDNGPGGAPMPDYFQRKNGNPPDPGRSVKSEPVVFDGKVYIASQAMYRSPWFDDAEGDTMLAGASGSAIWAVDAKTCDLLWVYPTAIREGGGQAQPVVGANERLVYFIGIAKQHGSKRNGHFLHAVDADTGVLKWKEFPRDYKEVGDASYGKNGMQILADFDLYVSTWTSLTYADGVLYYIALYGHDTALMSRNAATGELILLGPVKSTKQTLCSDTSIPGCKQSYVGDKFVKIDSAITVANGKVYFAAIRSKIVGIMALDANTGEVAQFFPLDKDTQMVYDSSKPVVADGMVYIEMVGKNTNGFDLETGSKVWDCCDTIRTGAGYPAVADGVIYSSGQYSEVMAKNAKTGEEIWTATNISPKNQKSKSFQSGVDTPITYADGWLYFSDYHNTYCISASSGGAT